MAEELKEKLLEIAKGLLGKPYKYGARPEEAPNYFDCSLFVQYVFGQIGIKIPRSTIEQAEFAGKKVEELSQIKEGDLIFIRGESGHYNKTFPEGIGHVALYLGDGKVIHATSKRISHEPIIEIGEVRIDKLDELIARSGPLVIIKRLL